MFSKIKDVKIKVKLVVGFLIVVAIGAFLGIMGLNNSREIARLTAIDEELNEKRDVISSALIAHYIWKDGLIRAVYAGSSFTGSLDGRTCGLGAWLYSDDVRGVTDRAALSIISEIDGPHLRIHEQAGIILKNINSGETDEAIRLFNEILPVAQGVISNLTKLQDRYTELINEQEEIIHRVNAQFERIIMVLIIVGAILGILIGYFLAQSICAPLSNAIKMLNELKGGHLSTRLRMSRGDEIGNMADTLDTFADSLQHDVVGTMKDIANGKLSANLTPYDSSDEIVPALMDTIETMRSLIIEDGGRALRKAAGKDLTIFVQKEYKGEYATMKENINSLIHSLGDAMSNVNEAVSQITSASGEISHGAQSLAEGANEQASSLEEISSSIEEMSSMTKQNADNSTQAKHLVSETGASISEANDAMKRMTVAIKQIKTSSDNTAKIVKTIDDIAFQTNLLALNAAVEAARAGEAGKGFAVVAEEVRNLAMRSAEAAKNTTDMIESSVKSADEGVKITEEVAKALDRTVTNSSKVSGLIAEIAAASNEQSQGIEQINTAVAHMNQVTQQNAANSEESASAAEELSSQAAELSNMVADFKLSNSSGNRGGSNRMPAVARSHVAPRKPAGIRPVALTDKRGGGSPTKPIKAVGSEEIIPLDDGDLMEF